MNDFPKSDFNPFVNKYKQVSIWLRPHLATEPINSSASKMGGTPNLNHFQHWPTCIDCFAPLNFVIQLYQKDFPGFYFPVNKNLFQLFRCPNPDCVFNYNERSDLKMYHYYFLDQSSTNNAFIKPSIENANFDKEVPDCFFKPQQQAELPCESEFLRQNDQEFLQNINKYAIEWIKNFEAGKGTKFNGYPHWEQFPNYPICNCGKLKTFFFQLSSEDLQEGQQFPPHYTEWSPHGIMIGDLGKLYYFVCKSCGENSIESRWDCG